MANVGLDVGRSAVKVAWRGKDGELKHVTIPSVAVPAMTISDKTASDQAAKETVTVDGDVYFIGETAIHEAGSLKVAGLHHRWSEMREFRALVQGAINLVIADVGRIDSVITGLPPAIFREKQLQMRNIVSACTEAEVKVYPEPNGVSMRYSIDEKGRMIPDAKKNMGVIAIGRFTTDSMALLNGRWVEEAAGSANGMSRAAIMVQKKLKDQGYEVDYLDADDALWKGAIQYYGKEIDVSATVKIAMRILSSEIFDAVSTKFGDNGRKLDKILVAGGGAELLFDGLAPYWPQAELIEDPRFAVAEGFRRFGEGVWNARHGESA